MHDVVHHALASSHSGTLTSTANREAESNMVELTVIISDHGPEHQLLAVTDSLQELLKSI